ncbi:MAG: radical SAM protein [Gammaproteobacteria bacterium]|nr:radical SAM protein [Gammaproteobacteria bacterium]
MDGRINQIVSFSTFDGPGTRAVVFTQGCPVGCHFCHNPETWEATGGTLMDVDELMRRLERFRSFLARPALTITGGEPLLQFDFVMALCAAARHEGWHVALDTSGCTTPEKLRAAAAAVDLIMCSIKPEADATPICKACGKHLRRNVAELRSQPTPVRLRYVLIPGFTDDEAGLRSLGDFARTFPNLESVELEPFNGLAAEKWDALGMHSLLFEHPLPPVHEDDIQRAREWVGRDLCCR